MKTSKLFDSIEPDYSPVEHRSETKKLKKTILASFGTDLEGSEIDFATKRINERLKELALDYGCLKNKDTGKWETGAFVM